MDFVFLLDGGQQVQHFHRLASVICFVKGQQSPLSLSSLASSEIVQLLAAADMYAVDELKVRCQLELIRLINVDTVLDVLAIADKFACPRLADIASRYLVNHVSELAHSNHFAAVIWQKEFRQNGQRHQSYSTPDDDENGEGISGPPKKKSRS